MGGYRVGGQCFATSEKASDYKMSMVVPAITSDGSLKLPVRQSDGWYYDSNKIQLTHPSCDELEYFQDGIQVGLIILSLFVISFLCKLIIRIVNAVNNEDKEVG